LTIGPATGPRTGAADQPQDRRGYRRRVTTPDDLLSRAFALAVEARTAGDHPFGALLAVDGEIVAEARNLVTSTSDLTAHAETELVRVLERDGRLGLLEGGVVYASCEPCPMCVGAMFWAGARQIVFGLSSSRLGELATAPGEEPYGFTITAAEIAARATPYLRVDGPRREDEAALPHLDFWRAPDA
jgi:tRNA(Arg) A34 adenosine deaminase TadA